MTKVAEMVRPSRRPKRISDERGNFLAPPV
jgi:hypothetical protein